MHMRFTNLLSLAIFVVVATTSRAADRHAHTVPCAYPDGWNSTDLQRDIDGIPKGRNHQCVVDDRGRVLDSNGEETH
jgi:hypothetical protein